MTQWWETAPLAEEPAAPKAAKAGGYWWEAAPLADKPGVVEDVAKTAPSALVRGLSYMYGLPGSMQDVADFTYGQTAGRVANKLKDDTWAAQSSAEVKARRDDLAGPVPSAGDVMRSDKMVRGVESVTGPLYHPKRLLGEYVNTGLEFLPSMALGGGLPQTLASAAASETAGQVARHFAPNMEMAARFGGAVLGGGGAALATAPRSSEMAISRGLSGLPAAQRQGAIQQAELLIQDAATQGVRLTWDEAIQQVTGGATRLGDLRRVVENSRGGGDVMKPLMAERPGQVAAAADNAIGGLAPNRLPSEQIGPASQRAAEGALSDVRAVRSAQAEPHYRAAAGDVVPPANVQRAIAELDQIIAGDPTRGELSAAARELRPRLIETAAVPGTPATRTPVLGPNGQVVRYQTTPAVPGTPEVPRTRVPELDAVYGAARDEFSGPLPVGTSGTAARGMRMTGQALNALDTELQAASPALRQGRQVYAQASRDLVEPAEAGALGQISKLDQVQPQGKALLPNAPPPGSEGAVGDTVRRLAARDPQAVENLIHSHVRGAFDEATQANATGPNQFGGAKFAAVVAGNGQQAQNLEAAVRALPNGAARWQGFRRFLDVMEATGQRPQQGSATAFNTEIQREMKQGGLVQEGLAAAKTGGMSMLRRFQDYRETMNLGRNTEQIARILTDPQSGRLLERLAVAPHSQAPVLALRLSYMGRSGVGFGPRGVRSSPEMQQSE